MQPTIAAADTNKAAAGRRRHGTGLLISGSTGILPNMTPNSKTTGNVGLKANDHQSPGSRTAKNQNKLRKIPGTKKGDHHKSHKKDQCSTKIPHDRQSSKTDPGKDHVQGQITLLEQFIKGCGTGKNKDQFNQLRWLDRKSSDGDPVTGTIRNLTQ